VKLKDLPAHLLTVGVLAVLLIWGGMTLATGGDRIARSVQESVGRASDKGFFDGVRVGVNSINAEYNLVFYKKQWYVSLNGAMRRVMGNSFFPSDDGTMVSIRLNDGLLAKTKVRMDVEACRGVLTKFKEFLDERGIDLIFSYAHTKVLYPETQLPSGVEDNSNEIADRFFVMLDELGIEYIDTRQVFRGAGWPATDVYFRTDGHWKIPASFLVFQELAARLNATGRFEIPDAVLDIDSYDMELRERFFLGNDGWLMGAAYSGLDDFAMLTPKFETRLSERSVTNEGVWEEREGTFEEAVLHMQHLMPDEGESYSTACYSVYGYNRPEIVITNELAGRGRVLFVKNSSGNPLFDFTALGVKEARGLDPRVLANSTVADYIDQYRPDAVVISYNYDFLNPRRLDFFRIIEDLGLG